MMGLELVADRASGKGARLVMLQWFRKKRTEPPAEAVASSPYARLVDLLLEQLPEREGAERLIEQAASFKRLPPAEQERELPATYLAIEQYLVDAVDIRAGAELRGLVMTTQEALLAQPGFRLIFEPSELQQIVLCRELLSTLFESSLDVLGEADDGLLRTALVWLAAVPDRVADPIPFDIEADEPLSTEDWIELLTKIAHAFYERMEKKIGQRATRRRFESAYDDLAQRYLGLPTFSVVIGLLPEKILDERQIRELDHGQMQQVVLDKVEHLKRINERLSEKNDQLEEAQNALEAVNEELEERVRDRTEALRLVNEDLRESEEQLRLITAAAHDAIVMLDNKGRVSFWNAAAERVFGFSKSHILGQDACKALVPQRFHSQFRRGLQTFSASGEGLAMGETVEWTALGRDRDEFPIELSLSSVRIQDRWHVLAVVRDITERRRVEKERRQLEERMQENQRLESLGLLAGGIAHDFNNLLASILGNAGLANLSPDSKDVAEHLREIETAAARAADLTQQMLAYSGRGQFVVEPFDLHELIEETAQLLKSSISTKADLACELSAELPAIEADRSQIQQVLIHLISNSSDALGDEAGSIVGRTGVLSADRAYLAECELGSELEEGSYVFVEVSDTGCGMDEETRGKIFDPFFSTKFVGRGLGLAAVLGIVRGHQGAIRVTSQPGEGTTFQVLFPASRAVAEAKAEAQPAESEAPAEYQASGAVLVVDDEPAVREMVSRALEILGFRVLAAEDGQHAVEVFGENTAEIDLVLMDMTMPRMNGREAFLKMRELRADARVILSSGYSQQDALRELDGDTPMGFLQKPYDLATLTAEVRSALEG